MVWRAAGPPGRVLISDLTDFGPVGGRCTDLTILGGLHSVGVMGRWVVVVCIRTRWMCGCADVTVCGGGCAHVRGGVHPMCGVR